MSVIVNGLVWLGVWAAVLYALIKGVRRFFALRASPSPWDPKGKGIVITGASSGIGKEVALAYAALGARLTISARRESELNDVAAECKKLGAASVLAVTGDMSQEDDVKRLMTQAAAAWDGVIDCIVLNAGISMSAPFHTLESKDLKAVKDITELNYYGVVYGVHYALPALKQSKQSKIVAVSSGLGTFGAPGRSAYSGSKFALQGFLDCVRTELGPLYGTQVTVVCPGVVKTDINRTRVGPISQVLDMDRPDVMKADTAAKMIVDSVARGDRQLLMTGEIVLANWVRFLFPDIFDALVINRFKKMQVTLVKKA